MPDRTTTSETCLICLKQRGEVPPPGGALYRDELVYASHGFFPEGQTQAYPGVLYAEPRRHAAALEDLTDEEAQVLGLLASRLARALKAASDAEHIYLFRLGHHVDHLHLLLLPRYPGTPQEYWGLKGDEWPGAPRAGEAEIAALCGRIRGRLEG